MLLLVILLVASTSGDDASAALLESPITIELISPPALSVESGELGSVPSDERSDVVLRESPVAAEASRLLFERTTVLGALSQNPATPLGFAANSFAGNQRTAHDGVAPSSSSSGTGAAAAYVDGSGRQLFDRTTLSDIVDTTYGPTLPIFIADLPDSTLEQTTFAMPTVNVKPPPPSPAPPVTPYTCDLVHRARCISAWQACLLQNAADINHVCDCYGKEISCYRDSGCYETVKRSDILDCFNVLACTLNQCEGLMAADAPLFNGITTHHTLHVGSLLLLLLTTVVVSIL